MNYCHKLWLLFVLLVNVKIVHARRSPYRDDDENAGEFVPFKRARGKKDMAERFKDMNDKPVYKDDVKHNKKGKGQKSNKKNAKKDKKQKVYEKVSRNAKVAEEVEVFADGTPMQPGPPTGEDFMNEDAAFMYGRDHDARRKEEDAIEADLRRRAQARDEEEQAEIAAQRKMQLERAPREFSRRMDRLWTMAQAAFKGNEIELTAVRAEIEALKASGPMASKSPDVGTAAERTERLWSLERRVLERARGYGPGTEEVPSELAGE